MTATAPPNGSLPCAEIVVQFRPTGDGSFEGEVLQGTEPLSAKDALTARLGVAFGLARNAKTETQWREAYRVWQIAVVECLRSAGIPLEFLALPATMNALLEELEQGRQPRRLTAVPREGRGNPGVGHLKIVRSATGAAVVDFLAGQAQSDGISSIEKTVAVKLDLPLKEFRNWRKQFKAGKKGQQARDIYEAALGQARASCGAWEPSEIAEILIRVARASGD